MVLVKYFQAQNDPSVWSQFYKREQAFEYICAWVFLYKSRHKHGGGKSDHIKWNL